jgi:hypothetical protein
LACGRWGWKSLRLDRIGLSALASVLGRAFVVEQMMRWPLGEPVDVEQRLIRCFEYFIEGLLPLGTVWETGDAMGALVWIPPDRADALEEAQPALAASTR